MIALQAQKIIDAMYLEAPHMDIVTDHALSVEEIHEFLDWVNDLIERQP